MVPVAYIWEREQWWQEYLEPAIIGPPWESIVLILLNDAKNSKNMVLLYTSTLMTNKISILHGRLPYRGWI